MRLWSLHPRYLDAQGLVSCWREGLLARKVLMDQTKGYRNHPQLVRFRSSQDPLNAIEFYLAIIAREAAERGYRFDTGKIGTVCECPKIPVTTGQLRHEWEHLKNKLSSRNPEKYREIILLETVVEIHPLFEIIEGNIEDWEKSVIHDID